MEPIRYRTLLKNRAGDSPFANAERAVLLLGPKVLGDISFAPLSGERGVSVFAMRFSVPGFRQWPSDPPLEAQQDSLVAALFEGSSVERTGSSVVVRVRGQELGRGKTWEEAFRASLPMSRLLLGAIAELQATRGKVVVSEQFLAQPGVEMLVAAGARRVKGLLVFGDGGVAMPVEPVRPSRQEVPVEPVREPVREVERKPEPRVEVAPPRTPAGANEPLSDEAEKSGLPWLSAQERQTYFALKKKGEFALAKRLMLAVMVTKLRERGQDDLAERLAAHGI